jgi:hypothetical protein
MPNLKSFKMAFAVIGAAFVSAALGAARGSSDASITWTLLLMCTAAIVIAAQAAAERIVAALDDTK